MLEVIGNNLANVNTTAFKSARTLFSDLMYENHRGASSGTANVVGSINPIQVGTGSKVSSVDQNFQQGTLESTGQDLDVALEGNGFFVASNGQREVYTRNGAFTLDQDGYLEDSTTGFWIQRFGTVGEPDGDAPAFQVSGDRRIRIPFGASISGAVTQNISFSGRLGANATGPTSQLLQGAPLTVGNVAVTDPAATLINDLDSTESSYGSGDSLEISGQLNNGGQISGTFAVSNTTTVQDLMNFIQSKFGTDATVSFADSAIQVESTMTGPQKMSLNIGDTAGNTSGKSNDNFKGLFSVLEPGRDATVLNNTMGIFDERGAEHTLDYTFLKQADGTWTLTVEMDPTSGVVNDGVIEGIQFAADGSLAAITGTGDGDSNIEIQFANSNVARTINISLGTFGDVDGLAEIGSAAEAAYTNDGYGPGELESVEIDADGTLQGVASNGVKFSLAQLAVASFRNPDGLSSGGNNYYEQSLASGEPAISTALSGDRGAIRAEQLESSNVDLALEFTRLLVAQRGFSANARTITVTDEVLEELTNIIR